MPINYSESCSDADAGALSLRRDDGVFITSKSFVVERSDGVTTSRTVERSLGQCVSAGIITAAERTEYLRISRKINNGLRTLDSLDP